MARTPTYTYVAGLDIGNGYTKGLIAPRDDMAVSYTHLTLPTNREV